MLQRLKNIIKHNRALYSFLLLLISPYRNYLDSRQRKLYELWQRDYKVVRTNKRLYRQPLVSIIVPAYNTPTKYLREMVQSVESQSYDNWELIIVDDASPDTGLKQEISAIAKTNAKIKPFFLKANHHIAGATNYGIHKASGEYVALLDHDDVLHPDALLRIVEKINNLPDVKFIYTDEVKLDERGRQYQPFFKPDWNTDFLRSVNYITHFAVIQRKLLLELEGEDGNYNGAQDWELFLRITRILQPQQIAHVSQILYYWRVHKNSTAQGLDAKPYVIDTQKRALNDDIKCRQVQAQVVRDSTYGAQWRLKYSTPQNLTIKNVLFSESITVGDVIRDETADIIVFSETMIKDIDNYSDMGDVMRLDIGAVVPSVADENRVIENLTSILDKKIVECIQTLSRRSFTKHIYLTARYNLGAIDLPVLFIERNKLASIDGLTRITSRLLTKALCDKGLKTLYNPYMTAKEEQ